MQSIWNSVRSTYKILEVLGDGPNGQVVKAKHRKTKQVVAIKLLPDVLENSFIARRTLRELSILRKLSSLRENAYTT